MNFYSPSPLDNILRASHCTKVSNSEPFCISKLALYQTIYFRAATQSPVDRKIECK